MAARGAALCPMVKADAYGLGVQAAVVALEPIQPWGYGVATIDEGRELRALGVARPIVLFTPVPPDELHEVRDAGLLPTLGCAADVRRWAALRGGAWHLAIDTGMNRAGARWDRMADVAAAAAAYPPAGAFTHFHSAERADGSQAVQEHRFERALSALDARPPLLHAENSAALARCTRSRWDVARPGIFLYGVGSGAGALVHPEPVVHVRARVVDLRDVPEGDTVGYEATWSAPAARRVATVAIGYADGYRRAFGNRAVALLHGRRVPVVGMVNMDVVIVDVTDVACAIGDVVTLAGRDGDALLDVEAVAGAGDLSPYEFLTGLRGRLPRVRREGA